MELLGTSDSHAEYWLHSEIAALLTQMGHGPIGDDCATIEGGLGGHETTLLVNVDRLARGVPMEVAAPLLVAQTLSDVICMGGQPRAVLPAVQVPRDTDPDDIVAFERAVASLSRRYGATLVGGDTKEGDEFSAVGVALGVVRTSRLVRRSPVHVGDAIVVTLTGGRGWGRRWVVGVCESLGLDLETLTVDPLGSIDEDLELPMEETNALIEGHTTCAGIDLSDGIGGALAVLGRANNIGFDISSDALRRVVDSRLAPVADELGLPTVALALTPGYMWENLYAVHPTHGLVDALSKDSRFAVIGEATSRLGVLIDGRSSDDIMAAASDEKFRPFPWEDRLQRWLTVMRDAGGRLA